MIFFIKKTGFYKNISRLHPLFLFDAICDWLSEGYYANIYKSVLVKGRLVDDAFQILLASDHVRRWLSVIIIKVKKGEQIEKAIKRLKKAMDKEGIIKQLRAERYFEKPSEKARKKSARARARARSLARRAALPPQLPRI